jgi:hypothetical protein
MHDSGHLRRGEEHRFFLTFDTNESKPGAVGAHHPFGYSAMAMALACGGARRVGLACGGFWGMTRILMAPACFSISTFQIVLPGSIDSLQSGAYLSPLFAPLPGWRNW